MKLLSTALVVLGTACVVLDAQRLADPLAFFHPSVELSREDRDRLASGEPVVRVLRDTGADVAVFGAVPVRIDGDRLVAWVRNIAELKRSPAVLAIGRVSNPPRLEDFDRLILDEAELNEIRQCRPGDCGLKLTADEISRLQTAMAAPSRERPRIQQVFRELMLRRVRDYLTAGGAALPRYADRKHTPPLGEVFQSILRQSTFLTERLPALADDLQRYPHGLSGDAESFIYWAKETFGRKPVISATHVVIVRPTGADLPSALVIGRQLFATHYMDGALSVTAIVRDAPASRSYLTYLNRTRVDSLGGFFGPFVRSAIERRLRNEAAELLPRVRDRLESGEPPTPALARPDPIAVADARHRHYAR